MSTSSPPPDTAEPFPLSFFDEPFERRGTDSLKWSVYARHGDAIPLWVADMDFRSAPPIADALVRRASRGDFGYAHDSQAAVEAMIDYHRADGLTIDPASVVPVPGLVCALNALCRAAGAPGDEVATTVPVYPPFLEAPGLSGRALVTVPMTRDASGRPAFNLPELQKALSPRARLFILCNPHNPLGRAWAADDLRPLLELCASRDITVCSDEVHGGLVLDPPHAYTPAAVATPNLADRIVTLLSPSKTFNLPGLSCAFAVIPDPALRQRFRASLAGIVPHVNLFGWVAAEAAYRHGEPWRRALLQVLSANRDTVEAAARAWSVDLPHVEATYLAWLDFRPWLSRMNGLSPAKFFLSHGVALMDGAPFGAPGFARLNFACRRALLEEALGRMSRSGLFSQPPPSIRKP